MKTLLIAVILICLTAYLLCMLLIYSFQRSLLYFPTPYIDVAGLEPVTFSFDESELQGWIVNPGKDKALLYFGGNSELITDNIVRFQQMFADHSIYLVNYRGFGLSQGKPTEAGLKSDALKLYDQIQSDHQSISALGRSLGSGVAVYLTTNRTIEKLILLTPYDSIANVAQHHYPIFPTRHLVKDRYDSANIADEVTTDVLIVAANQDAVVPIQHARALHEKLVNTDADFVEIDGAAHNNITEYPRYHSAIEKFMQQ